MQLPPGDLLLTIGRLFVKKKTHFFNNLHLTQESEEMRGTISFTVVFMFMFGSLTILQSATIPFYAEEHLHKGNEYFSRQQYEEAIREYKDAILFAKEYDEAYFRLGYVYMVMNNYEEAKNNFLQAIELRENYMEAHYCLGQVYQKLAKPDMAKAQEHCLKAVELFDSDTPKLVKLGSFTALGNCYRAMENYPKAVEYYEKALKINPDQLSVLNNMAVVYLEQNDFNNAKKYYEKAIKVNPDYSPAYTGLAGVYKALGNTDKAIEIYNNILADIDSNDPEVRKQLGDIYMAQEKFELALEHFEYLTKLEPKNSNHWNDLGIAYDSLEKYAEAIASFKYAQELDPQNYYSSYYLAYTYEHQDNMDQAVAVLQNCLDNRLPSYMEARVQFRLAGLWALSRQEEKVFTYLQKAVEIDPSFKQAAKEDPRLKRYVNKSKFKKLLADTSTPQD
jgi:superkiller protein 3